MYLDGQGKRIDLGGRVGSPGGEGTTFAVVGRAELVAKIYHAPPDAAKCRKLMAQAAATLPGIRSLAAWPLSLVHDKKGAVAGFLMQRVAGKSVHLLYRPDDRAQHFAGVTWQGLVDVARNVAAAFHALHRHGVVMGDVNESNILVDAESGGVKLIDCDSFQFTSVDGSIHPCPVFTAGWTPPELLETPSLISQRSIQHDRFGLAVLIFHLLFMGRHPFAGVPPENLLENPPSLEDLIKRGVFPYSAEHRGGFRPPPRFLGLTVVPERVAALFERAFISRDRPGADEWFRELGGIELSRCRWGHIYYRKLSGCPWCEVWNRGGGNFFITLSLEGGTETLVMEIDALLSQVKNLMMPGSGAVLGPLATRRAQTLVVPDPLKFHYPSPAPQPFPRIFKFRLGFGIGGLLFIGGLVVAIEMPLLFILWIAMIVQGLRLAFRGTTNPAYNAEVQRRMEAPGLIREDIDLLIQVMQRLSIESAQSFEAERDEACRRVLRVQGHKLEILRELRASLQKDLLTIREASRNIPRLKEKWQRMIAEKSQLETQLRSIPIPYAAIPGLDRVRSEILVARGINTAWDLKRAGKIPGLGTGEAELRHWLRTQEDKFHFDPQTSLSLSGRQEVQRRSRAEEARILKEFQGLRTMWAECQRLADAATFEADAVAMVWQEVYRIEEAHAVAKKRFAEKLARLEAKIEEYGQAQADARTCPRELGKWE